MSQNPVCNLYFQHISVQNNHMWLVVAVWGSLGLDPFQERGDRGGGANALSGSVWWETQVMLNWVTPNQNFVPQPGPPTYFCLCFWQDYTSENSALLSSAKSSPQDSVSRSPLLNRLEFETAFASFSASLVAVINHREWFLPETDLAGEVTGFEGIKVPKHSQSFY